MGTLWISKQMAMNCRQFLMAFGTHFITGGLALNVGKDEVPIL